jgi:transcriptional regulator with XRE-family HTH domain
MPRQHPAAALRKLGRRIRARRYFLQLPFAYFAKQVRLSTSMLNAYEAGRAQPPCMTLLRIAAALGTSTSDLLGERDKDNSEDLDFMIGLFADPSIHAVAMAMLRMDDDTRQELAMRVAA